LASAPLPCGIKFDRNAPLATTKFCLYEGITIYENDIVMIQSASEQVMFVKVRDFKIDSNGNRSFIFSWMVPKQESLASAESGLFPNDLTEGPDHPEFVPIEHIKLVYYSPASIHAPLRDMPST
jgi:hypothetical protein